MPKARAPSPAASLPAVGRLLEHPALQDRSRSLVLVAARAVLADLRRGALIGSPIPDLDEVAALVGRRVTQSEQPALRPVLNATGVVVHTNLGRAPLAREAIEAVVAAAGTCDLEMDLESGRRGERLRRLRALLMELSGAEDAIVVNNNAAAVLLVLTALARGRQVVASRGEAVEIGASFRIPDVVAAGGARLVEVGCTNRTRLADYAAALSPKTAGILKIHPSNFRIRGFTASVDRAELAGLAEANGIWLVEDIGSGRFFNSPPLHGEPLVREVVAQGVHLVCFSGDKLLGGPQAGVILGRASLVQKLAHHPLYRALRPDKLTIAALDATLRLYRAGHEDHVPVVAMLQATPEALRARAKVMAEALAQTWPHVRCVRTSGRAGGGALPDRPLPSWAVAIDGVPPDDLAARLRALQRPVFGRVHRNTFLLDPRTLLPEQGDDEAVVAALRDVLAETDHETNR
jgi:L-seryl-tRNA(Ser) seleniumtransferase